MTDNRREELTVRRLLENSEYRIPIYQRNYAWEKKEVMQLVQDVADYAKDRPDSNYYIGTLVVFPRVAGGRRYFETIDGQQRTTTLTLIASVLRHRADLKDCMAWYGGVNISFEHREKSNDTLAAIYDGRLDVLPEEATNVDIKQVAGQIEEIVNKACKARQIDVTAFAGYLFGKVYILRVEVPKDTNLNHYFEIMNSRGEQLEHHEVVKARLMNLLRESPDDMAVFDMIWEACSNMERYVQMNFNKDVRTALFADNGTGRLLLGFDGIVSFVAANRAAVADDCEAKSLHRLFQDDRNGVSYRKPWKENLAKGYPETFHPVISFSNFLLHVLKIIRPANADIALDDKRLITVFDKVMREEADRKGFAKEFIGALLRLRWLFDKYIIKRKQEKWSLQSLVTQKGNPDKYYYRATFSRDNDDSEDDNADNRQVAMLLTMFHVSAPTQNYKNWLYAALLYVYAHEDVTAVGYARYLWTLARAYMLDVYLAGDDALPFETIIRENKGQPKHRIEDACWRNINIGECPRVGEAVENFVFNFYDYLLWRETNDADFDFDYRTSVEHFYPQHPINRAGIDYGYLHSFGNLCIVSRSINSKFSNSLPEAKVVNYGGAEDMKSYSMKLKGMMAVVKGGAEWAENRIKEEEQKARERMEQALS